MSDKQSKRLDPIEYEIDSRVSNANLQLEGRFHSRVQKTHRGTVGLNSSGKDGILLGIQKEIGQANDGYQAHLNEDGKLSVRRMKNSSGTWKQLVDTGDMTNYVKSETYSKNESDNKYLNRQAIALQGHESIDNLLETGVYRTQDHTQGTFPKDLHAERLGMLVALKHSHDQSTQILYSLFNNKNYMRVKKAGSLWTDWSTQLDTDLSKVFKTPSGKILKDADNLTDNGYVITDNNTANLPNISEDGKHGIIKFVKTSNPTTRKNTSGVQYFTSGKGTEAGTMYTRVKRDGQFDPQWKVLGNGKAPGASYQHDNVTLTGDINNYKAIGSRKVENGKTTGLPTNFGQYGTVFYIPEHEGTSKGTLLLLPLDSNKQGFWVKSSGTDGNFSSKKWEKISSDDMLIGKPEQVGQYTPGAKLEDIPSSGIYKIGGDHPDLPAQSTHAILFTFYGDKGRHRGFQAWYGCDGGNEGKKYIRIKARNQWQQWQEDPSKALVDSKISKPETIQYLVNINSNTEQSGIYKTGRNTAGIFPTVRNKGNGINTTVSDLNGILFNTKHDASNNIIQTWTALDGTGKNKIFTRTYKNSQWTQWVESSDDKLFSPDNNLLANAETINVSGAFKTDNTTQGTLPDANKNGVLQNFMVTTGKHTQIWTGIDATNKDKIFIRTIDGVTVGNWVELGQRGPAGPPGGGGARPDIVLPFDDELGVEYGEYGMNLFDYRTMSRDNHFGVDGKVFYNKGYTKFDTGTNHGATLYNRIRKKDTIVMYTTLLETTDNQTHTKIEVKPTRGAVGDFEVDIDPSNSTDVELRSTKEFDEYSYLKFQLGGDGKEVKSRVKIDAYYGSIRPTELDQRFNFRKYNNHTLRAMRLYNPVDGQPMPPQLDPKQDGEYMRDFYVRKKRGNQIVRKIGLFELKDVTEFNYKFNKDKNVIFIPVPEDFKTGSKNMMTNNLCDLTETEADGALPVEDKPFFVRATTGVDMPRFKVDASGKPIYDKTGKPKIETKQVECFQIMLTKDYARNWREHLAKTQIMYELDHKHRAPRYTGEGGQVYVLTDGSRIHTAHYEEVKPSPTAKKYIIEFNKNIYSGADRRVFVDDVIEVIDYAGPKATHPIP